MQTASHIRQMEAHLHVAQRSVLTDLSYSTFLVRIFIGQVPLKLNITHGKYAELVHVEREILAMVSVLAGTLAVLMGQVPFTPLMIVTFPSPSVVAMWLLVY